MTVDEAIAALDELFDSPERWIKGAAARSASGHWTFPYGPTAVCWCLTGGILKVVPPNSLELQLEVVDALSARLSALPFGHYGVFHGGAIGLRRFNDHPATTFAHVKAVLHDS